MCLTIFINRSFGLVMAALSVANVVKSSLGPLGLDKMLVDNVGVSIKLSIMPTSSTFITYIKLTLSIIIVKYI